MLDISTVIQNEKTNKILLLSTAIFMMGILTLKTFMSSDVLELTLLSLTLVLLIFHYIISNKSITIYRIEIMWFLFLVYFVFNILYQGRFMKIHILDIFIFTFIFLLLLLYKVNVNYFITAFKAIFIFSFVYALSAIFQYLYMDLYSKYVLYRFNDNQIEEILRLIRNGNYTGFTNQTAYLAGFLVFGIGVVVILYKNIVKKFYHILFIISIPLLFYSLLLTGKRAHLLFMFISLIITFLFSTEIKKFFNQFMKVIIGIGFFLLAIIFIFANYTPNVESQFGKVYFRIESTIEGFIAGEDVTSGRVYLYEHALNLFNEAPILGIGWRGFYESSLGVINLNKLSHPHNIYIQLLTELGIVGFLLFMIPVVYAFIRTIKLLMNTNTLFKYDLRWKVALQYSLFIQSFFLLYGITGNLLTDHIFLLMYFFAVTITLSSMKYAKLEQMNTIKSSNQNIDSSFSVSR